jgi:putative DNA primase/helicase
MDIPNVAELRPNIIDEEELAQRFVDEHHSTLRYIAEFGHWMHYSEGSWKREKTLYAFDLARKICRKGSNKMKRWRNAKTYAAIEKIAKADRKIAATAEQWDRDKYLLNTPDGTIDLRTGKMRQHDPADYITKMTAVTPGGKCPTWDKHLKRILPPEIVSFLYRFWGYSLTGDTREDQWLFAWGEGSNGKNTTFDAITGLMGDYHCKAVMESFVVSKYPQHPTDLAKLRGARYVTANETAKNRTWDEAKINDEEAHAGLEVAARLLTGDPVIGGEIFLRQSNARELESLTDGELLRRSIRELQRLPVDLNQDGFRGSGEALWH